MTFSFGPSGSLWLVVKILNLYNTEDILYVIITV